MDSLRIENLSELECSILEACMEAFQVNGFHDTNIDNIASSLNIGKGTIYRHFGTKVLLFLSTTLYGFAKCVKHLSEIDINGDFYEAFDKYIEVLASSNLFSGSFMKGILGDEGKDIQNAALSHKKTPEIVRAVFKMRSESVECLAKIIETGKRAGEVGENINASTAAEIIYISVNNYIRVKHLYDEVTLFADVENPFKGNGIEEISAFVKRGLGVKDRK